MNMDYCLSELKALLSIDSPSGFTDKAADYLIGELTALGYAPEKTRTVSYTHLTLPTT